jgi:hypothetical protein
VPVQPHAGTGRSLRSLGSPLNARPFGGTSSARSRRLKNVVWLLLLALILLAPDAAARETKTSPRPPELELNYLKCLMRIEGEDSFVMLAVRRPSQSFKCLENRSAAARADWTMRGMIVLGTLLHNHWGFLGEYPRTDRIEEVVQAVQGFEPFELVQADGWGTPLRYRVSRDAQYFELTSAGADGRFENLLFGPPPGESHMPTRKVSSFEADIVITDMHFLQAPVYYWPGESGCEKR